MDADWSVLLTSDFSCDVVPAVSFDVSLLGAAGIVPTGLTGVVALAVSAIDGVLGADKSSFLQPKSKTQTLTALNRAIDFFIVIPVKFDKCFVNLINTYHPSGVIQTLSDNGAFVCKLFCISAARYRPSYPSSPHLAA